MRAVIVDEESGQTYSTIRPDIIVEDSATGRSVPIDVKYKLYDSAKKVSTADIYQLFVYAYSVGAQAEWARAALIYPAVTSISGPALYIRPLATATPARIRGVGIDVAATLEAVNGSTESLLHAQVHALVRGLTGLHGDSTA